MVMRTGNQAAPAPGAGGSPQDDYLHMPRPKGMSTTGTNAAGALSAKSSVSDYMKARGAQPASSLNNSKFKAKQGAPAPQQPGTPPGIAKKPGSGGVGNIGRRSLPPGNPPKMAPQTTIAPGGSMAQSGNPSAQRANAFNAQWNAQKLAGGPARPQSNNGLAPPRNPGTVQPVVPPAPTTGGGAISNGWGAGGNGTGGSAAPASALTRPGTPPPMRPPQVASPTGQPAPQQANAPGAGALTKSPASNVQPKPMQMGGGGGSTAGPQPSQQTAVMSTPRPRIA